MRSSLPQWLIRYGLFLISVGIIAVMYEPKSGQIGYNPAAKTALISGGVCGGISLLWGALLRSGHLWARIGAILSCSLFFAAFSWRATAAWMACIGGQTEKWYAASLITCMWGVTLGLLVLLVRNRDSGQDAEQGGCFKTRTQLVN